MALTIEHHIHLQHLHLPTHWQLVVGPMLLKIRFFALLDSTHNAIGIDLPLSLFNHI